MVGSSGRSRSISRGYSCGSCMSVMSENRLSGREMNKIKKKATIWVRIAIFLPSNA